MTYVILLSLQTPNIAVPSFWPGDFLYLHTVYTLVHDVPFQAFLMSTLSIAICWSPRSTIDLFGQLRKAILSSFLFPNWMLCACQLSPSSKFKKYAATFFDATSSLVPLLFPVEIHALSLHCICLTSPELGISNIAFSEILLVLDFNILASSLNFSSRTTRLHLPTCTKTAASTLAFSPRLTTWHGMSVTFTPVRQLIVSSLCL